MSKNFLIPALLLIPAFLSSLSIAAWGEPATSILEKPDATQQEQLRTSIDRHLSDLVKNRRTRDGWLGDGSLPDGVRLLANLVYVKDSTSPGHKLDIYLPKPLVTASTNSANKTKPQLVVWIHGGGWRGGDKKGGPIKALLDAGFAVASINYRLSGEAKWPAQLDDCREALSWLDAHAPEYGIDKNKIALWGASAGGHLVLMLALKDGTAHGVTAACDWFGPTDLVGYLQSKKTSPNGIEMIKQLLDANTDEQLITAAKDASPIYFIEAAKKTPALLVVHGKQDPLVPVDQSETLVQKMKSTGNENVTLKVVDGGHGFPGFNDETISTVIKFFNQNLSNYSIQVPSKSK